MTNSGLIEFGSSNVSWSSIYRWNNVTDTPPDYTFYSIYSLEIYFYIFIGISFGQLITIFALKLNFSQSFSAANFLQKIIHCLENVNIPTPYEEWDTGSGSAYNHFERMKACKKETLLIILSNLIFNCIFLVPICCLGA